MEQNKPVELPVIFQAGYHTVKSMLKSCAGGQAMHNAYAVAQNDREERVRANLDKLETMQNEQKTKD